MAEFVFREKLKGSIILQAATPPQDMQGLIAPGTYAVSQRSEESLADLIVVQPLVNSIVEISGTQTIGIPVSPIDFSQHFIGNPLGEDEYSLQDTPGWGSVDSVNGLFTGTPTAIGVADFIVRRTHLASGLYAEIAFSFIVQAAAVAPDAFATTQWSFLDAAAPSGGQAIIRITSHPFDGGSPITQIHREINGAVAVILPDIALGDYVVTGLTTGAAANCRIRAVNAIGVGAWSGTKTATPTAASGYAPLFINSQGAGHLRKEGNTEFTDTAFFALRVLVRSLTNLNAGVSQVLNSASDNWNVRFTSDGAQLRVSLKDTAGVTIVDWTSATGQNASAVQKLYYIWMNASIPSFGVELNGVNITTSGTYTVSPITGTGLIDHRTSAGATSDYALGARRDAASVADMEWADASLDITTIVAGSQHYATGAPKNPTGIGSPALLLKGHGFETGVNEGNGQDWTPFSWGGGGTPTDILLPEPRIGFGAAVTGGLSGSIYWVTNNSDSASTPGSFRWAAAQGPGYIIPKVEALTYLSSQLTMGANRTVYGQFAPGSGFKITGTRINFQGSNFIWEHMEHFGNQIAWDSGADCVRGGIYGGTGGQVTQNVYIAHSGFYHGKDETFTSNGGGTGAGNPPNYYRNVTHVYNVIGTPIGNNVSGPTELPHNYCWFQGSGAQKVTNMFNLCSRGTQRNPLFDDDQQEIEHFCNANYNFPCGTVDGHTNMDMMTIRANVQVSLRNNLWRMGPNYQGLIRFVLFQSTAPSQPLIYIDGNIADTKIGKIPTPLYESGITFAASQPFAGSGVALVTAPEVEAVINAKGGAFGYGGIRRSYSQEHISDFVAGTGPTGFHLYTNGPVPASMGKTYPPCNVNNVPNEYLTYYPADVDPNVLITDGSAWDTGKYKVIDRIAAFMISPLNTWTG